MRLKRFEVRNFKGLKSVSFEWDRFAVLIGENNVGKSSLLQALDWFLSGSAIKDENLCHNHVATEENPVELIGYFVELTDVEKTAPAVHGRLLGEEWVLKKKFWCDADGNWKEQYLSMSQPEEFIDWPNSTTSWNAFPASYRDLIDVLPDRGARPNMAKLDQLKNSVRDRKPELVRRLDATWVPNPGGGGNWKSNANSILPRAIFIHAVQEAAAEAISKEVSSYGKIISLLLEKKLMQRAEIQRLREDIAAVFKLFSPDPEHPELQAPEIREIQESINIHLNEIVGGSVRIATREANMQPLFLPNTTLMMTAEGATIETTVEHQGHGLQRSLIITLLQVLAAVQGEIEAVGVADNNRPVIFMIEEPELYMHPQMERKMRDALYRVASQDRTQVVCCTHSPVFLDMGQRHKSIVRVSRENGAVAFSQVLRDLFDGPDAESKRDRLQFLSEFHAAVNEVFFARRVALLEGRTELAVFDYAAQRTGLFERHPDVRRDVSLIDCRGKSNIPLFQTVLNHFAIPYLAVYDEDAGAEAAILNTEIDGLAAAGNNNATLRITPRDIETLLGYAAGSNKPYRATKRVEELCNGAGLPGAFIKALNQAYFRQDLEP
jgi:putative ATP-dependent endonuclease of OLD family